MRKILITFLTFCLGLVAVGQQNPWTRVSETVLQKNPFTKKARPLKFQLFQLNEKAMKASLFSVPSEKKVSAKDSPFIITIPNEEGQPEQFKLVEAPVMDATLSAKHPEIKAYAGRSLTDSTATIRFSFTPKGFRGMVLSAKKPALYIKKAERGSEVYVFVSSKDLPAGSEFECTTTSTAISRTLSARNSLSARNADDGKFRTFRLAFAASAEFSNEYDGGAGLSDAARKANVLAEQEAQLVIVNGHIERDFAVSLIMIDNEDIIYLDPATDPFTGGSPDSDILNAEAQTAITDAIGSDNFDIGHLIRRGDAGSTYGNAGAIGSVCQDDIKARGFTTRDDWHEIDVYSEIMLTHEFGHQLGANHTFTHIQDNDNAQMEPGSGSTIMSYGGSSAVEDADLQVVERRDHYFHAISIQQATDYTKGVACGTEDDAGNSTPTADAGSDFTIPKSTPFKLTGSGADADADDVLTYTWEQMDKLVEGDAFGNLPSVNNDAEPVFRSFPPSVSPTRFFPSYTNILFGTTENKWEKVPDVSRDLNFRFTVRDNNPGAGQNNSDDMIVAVDEAYGPFYITSPIATDVWCPGTHAVTWEVNGSDALAANVKISLSTDGGLTFPTVLIESTENDGSADVNITCAFSATARIMIEAIDNIFFDISDNPGAYPGDFTIGDNSPPTFTAPADITIYKDENCTYDAGLGITGDVEDEADNCGGAVTITHADEEVAGDCEGEVKILRTWTAEDGCGLKSTQTQTITITDTTPPTFTEPDDITIYKDDNCNHDAGVDKTGNVTDEDDNCNTNLDAIFTDAQEDGRCAGELIITRTWSLTDDCGNTTTHDQIIYVKDTTSPVISNISANPAYLWPPNHKMVNVTISYDVSDNCSSEELITKELTAIISNEPINSLGDGDTEPIDYEIVGTDGHSVRLRAERSGNGDGRIYTVYIKVTDDCGNSTEDSAKVYVVHNIKGPITGKPFKIGSTVAFNGEFWDVPGNKHTAKWELDEITLFDGTVTAEPSGNKNGQVTGSYKFSDAGVYKVKMNITDQKGVTSYATTNGDQEEIIVIYDPSGGHTFGGGWFLSSAGALKANPASSGVGTYGFAANYFKKSTTPKGEAQFVFKVGDFEFNAVNMEYLSIAGDKAQIKGSGRITGLQSGISFILTVIDGESLGNVDKIRLKIFNKNTGHVYYDNQSGASDADDPLMDVGANSMVVVQSNKGKTLARGTGEMSEIDAETSLSITATPNPSTGNFTLYITGDNAEERIAVTIFDLNGRTLETHSITSGSHIRIGDNYHTGTYIVQAMQGYKVKQIKLLKLK